MTIFQFDIIVILRNEILQFEINVKRGEKMRISDKKFEIALANSGLTVGQAAERVGISRQRYSMILNQKNVTPLAAGKIARSLGVDVTEIIETE